MVEVLRPRPSSIEQFRAPSLPTVDSYTQPITETIDFVLLSKKVRARRLGVAECTPMSVFDSEEIIDTAIKTFGEGRWGERSRLLVTSGARCESRTPEGDQCTNACVCAINIDMGGMEDSFPACREHVFRLMQELVEDVAANGMSTIPGINGNFRA